MEAKARDGSFYFYVKENDRFVNEVEKIKRSDRTFVNDRLQQTSILNVKKPKNKFFV